MTEEDNESEPLKDIIESDEAVEPDAKAAEELIALQEKEDMQTAYTAAKILIPAEPTSSKKRHQRRQKENTATTIINISKQLYKQTAEIERTSSILQSIQKYIKPLKQQSELINQVQSQIEHIQKQISQIQKYIAKKKNTI